MEDRKMTRQILNRVFLASVLLATAFPGLPLMAQNIADEQLAREETMAQRGAEIEQRRAEYFAGNPEAAERFAQRKAEREARREEFRGKYPEAATELERMRNESRSRREEFRTNHPEAAAELQGLRREKRSRRQEFMQNHPGATERKKAAGAGRPSR